MDAPHIPVLYNEIITALRPQNCFRFVDGTLGAGGHAFGLLENSPPQAQLLGLDRDPQALEIAAQRLQPFAGRAHLRHASYLEMQTQAQALGWQEVDAILLDLGISSMQIDTPQRGFSFLEEGPLDMRFDPSAPLSAADLVNGLSEAELTEIFFRYGEERHARRLARAICQRRPLSSTRQLADLALETLGRRERHHPATRIFQALRIAVNAELEAVAQVLPLALGLLCPGGRLAVISFHSLEDRLVKTFFHQESRDCLCPPRQPVCTCGHHASLRELTRKPLEAASAEMEENSRSRSARLRVIEKL